jgi:hypothetical protein
VDEREGGLVAYAAATAGYGSGFAGEGRDLADGVVVVEAEDWETDGVLRPISVMTLECGLER